MGAHGMQKQTAKDQCGIKMADMNVLNEALLLNSVSVMYNETFCNLTLGRGDHLKVKIS